MKTSAVLICLYVLGAAARAALAQVPTQAQAPTQSESLKLCMQQDDDARRLTCYDKALGRRAGQPENFGMTPELMRKKQAKIAPAAPAAPEREEELTSKVTKVSHQANGRFVVTLDNGQMWSQTESLDFPVQSGDAIRIEKGFLGGIWLALPSRQVKTHVKRIE